LACTRTIGDLQKSTDQKNGIASPHVSVPVLWHVATSAAEVRRTVSTTLAGTPSTDRLPARIITTQVTAVVRHPLK
jgi:hypothetical protein